MSIAALIRRMTDAGATPEAIAIAVEAIEARDNAEAERKAKNAARKAAQRARQSQDSHATEVGQGEDTPPKKEIPPTPPKEKTTPLSVSGGERAREFADFWALFPNKVGKRDAEKAFPAARQRADFETIMAGLRRYVAKTDDRPWCNPSTFLNQDRWADQPAAPVPKAHAPPREPNHMQQVNETLQSVINGNAAHEPNTIDASYERTDRGGSANLVQFDAAATRYRPG